MSISDVSLFVSKLRWFEKIEAINTFEMDSSSQIRWYLILDVFHNAKNSMGRK